MVPFQMSFKVQVDQVYAFNVQVDAFLPLWLGGIRIQPTFALVLFGRGY